MKSFCLPLLIHLIRQAYSMHSCCWPCELATAQLLCVAHLNLLCSLYVILQDILK